MSAASIEVPHKPPTGTATLTEVPARKTLVDKVAEACNAVGGIEKKGRNQKHGYDYVMAADVAAAFRHELFNRGIVLLQDEESVEFTQYETNAGAMMQECRLKIKFTLRDNTGEMSVSAYGVGRDTFDKAIYKAKTGATKYFLRGLGLIPDRADDPEQDGTADQEVRSEKHVAAPSAPATAETFPPRKPVTEDKPTQSAAGSILNFQKNAFLSAAKKSNKSQQQIVAYLGTIGCESLDEMPKKSFPEALKWAMEQL